MQSKRRITVRSIIRHITLVVCLLVMANFVLFLHVQRDIHGRWIVHAHPYSLRTLAHEPGVEAHSSLELLVLQEMLQLEATPTLQIAAIPIRFLHPTPYIPAIQPQVGPFCDYPLGRAPPAIA